ncbi:hypothetical protein Slu03_05600 [Sediminihabitans luteus]|nr:hypothetical protein Slu03_05600 [Sediminihabitans luteus]
MSTPSAIQRRAADVPEGACGVVVSFTGMNVVMGSPSLGIGPSGRYSNDLVLYTVQSVQ